MCGDDPSGPQPGPSVTSSGIHRWELTEAGVSGPGCHGKEPLRGVCDSVQFMS